MGQYHVLVNLSRREFVHPHSLGDLLKLREMANSQAGVGVALMVLLACSNGRGMGDFIEDPVVGRWAGDRIALVGDYAEDSDLLAEFKASAIYDLCRCEGEEHDEDLEGEPYTDISELVKPVIEDACMVTFKVDERGGTYKQDKPTSKRIWPAMNPDMVVTDRGFEIGPFIKGGIRDDEEENDRPNRRTSQEEDHGDR